MKKNPATAPYVNFVRSLNAASLRKQVPEFLSRFNDRNLQYAAELKNQVLTSPLSQLLYNNFTSSLAYAKFYFQHVEQNPTVAHGLELATNYFVSLRERVQFYLNTTKRTTSVVVEEVKEEVVATAQAVKEEVNKKEEKLEKIEAESEKTAEQAEVDTNGNGNHVEQATVLESENNEVPQADDEEEVEEEAEENN
jgi:hypothetical protein